MNIPDEHWSRDWDLLAAVANDFKKLRDNCQMRGRPQNETLSAMWPLIFGEDDCYPNLRKPFESFSACVILRGSIGKYYYDPVYVRGSLRLRMGLSEVLPDILLRLTFLTWRGSSTWILRRNRDPHWAVWWNNKTLPEEIRRALKHHRKFHASGRSADVNYQAFEDGNVSIVESISELHDLLEVVEKEKLILASDASTYKLWFSQTGEGDHVAESKIAKELDISLNEMNSVIRKVSTALVRSKKTQNHITR